jgi:hypothetical protein
MDTLGGTPSNPPAYNTPFVNDANLRKNKTSTFDWDFSSRITAGRLNPNLTSAETAEGSELWAYQNGYGTSTSVSTAVQSWNFARAPGFFDVVCYTGTGSARTVAHNLAAVPEMMLVKRRDAALEWTVYVAPIGSTNYLVLNQIAVAQSATNRWNDTTPTASVFTLGASSNVNANSGTYVAYLFATCPGVSKVFNFTGNGSSQTINCGFTGGARFVMIKRTDSTGDWYVWDTARGIVANNDPHLSLNTTAAEVTSNDTIDTDSTGFVVNQVSATNVNVNGASYIGLAIA